MDDDLKAFLECCAKDWWDKVTQFHESNFGYVVASTSNTLDVKVNEEVTNPYPTYAN